MSEDMTPEEFAALSIERATKKRGDVERLKAQWCADPHWDIYETEGFEEYRGELWDYQQAKERQWRVVAHDRLMVKARRMGIPDNLTLAEYIDHLEQRIAKLEDNR